jgi:hypothetical protein
MLVFPSTLQIDRNPAETMRLIKAIFKESAKTEPKRKAVNLHKNNRRSAYTA